MQELLPITDIATLEDLITSTEQLPIEELAELLKKHYTFEELLEIEPEFIMQAILKYDKNLNEDSLPPFLFEKLSALVAILNQPFLITQSLEAFYNTILVCNNLPSGETDNSDIKVLPSCYIPRTLLAINTILPDDMDLTSMSLHPNIKNYIFDCYYHEDAILLDPILADLQELYLYSKFNKAKRELYSSLLQTHKKKFEEIFKLILSTIKDIAPENVDLDDYTYQTFISEFKDLDILDIKTRLFKLGFNGKLTEILSDKILSNPFYTRAVSLYFSNILYSYLFVGLSKNIATKKVIVGINFASYPIETYKAKTPYWQHVLKHFKNMAENHTFLCVFFHDPSQELSSKLIAAFERSLKESGLNLDILHYDTNRFLLKKANIGDNILDYAYKYFGPPNMFVLLTNKDNPVATDYRIKYPGWDCYLL